MYRLVIYPEVQEQIAALPDEALIGYADVLDVLELAPWSGQSQHAATATAACVDSKATCRPRFYPLSALTRTCSS
ncbi:MAG: hypothetical protein LC799_07430 [Actinobacteria bacterium]|nr:hypothetical protein [Actinomycetota bacterium]